jgi:hypothetical protein
MNPAVRRAIERIDEAAWIPIRYPNAVFDDDAGVWISEAEGRRATYTAFAGTRHAITRRLVARRVRRQAPPGQDELCSPTATTPSSPTPRCPPWTPT